jgi:hypothetical protein
MQDRQLLKHILEATRDLWDRPETRASVRKEFPAVINCGTPALGGPLSPKIHLESLRGL